MNDDVDNNEKTFKNSGGNFPGGSFYRMAIFRVGSEFDGWEFSWYRPYIFLLM